VSILKRGPMKRREEMSFLERIYVVEVVRGVMLTFGRLIQNFFLHVAHLFGIKTEQAAAASIQYPEVRRPYPERYRGRHRLTLYPNGDVKCTACFLCATACPAHCIYIEAAEHDDRSVEKFPHRYEIDTLLCIYCGYCVEACPVDAIRMDTGLHPEVYPPDPRCFIEDKELLMERSRMVEDLTPEEMFRQHMLKVQSYEKGPRVRQ
jgi:NADH-quinone oxidoreductase subunit I